MYPLFIDFSARGDREQFKTMILLYIAGYLMPTLSTLVKCRFTLFSVKLPRYRAGITASQANNYYTAKYVSAIVSNCEATAAKSQSRSNVLTITLFPLILYSLSGKTSSSVLAYSSIPATS